MKIDRQALEVLIYNRIIRFNFDLEDEVFKLNTTYSRDLSTAIVKELKETLHRFGVEICEDRL